MINFSEKIGRTIHNSLKWLFSLSSEGWKSAVWGGIIGFLLVIIVEWLRKPKIKFLKYKYEKFNIPEGLYKVEIETCSRLRRFRWLRSFTNQPGTAILEIRYRDKIQFAKWDEMPNPLQDDDPQKFEASMVPQTFYQTLFLNRIYNVPIIHKDEKEQLTIFCGWWFGKDRGYGSIEDYKITKDDKICLILRGANVFWKKQLKISDVLNIRS